MSLALDQEAMARGILPDVITRDRPVDNRFIGRFNWRLRGESLNLHHFNALAGANAILKSWPRVRH